MQRNTERLGTGKSVPPGKLTRRWRAVLTRTADTDDEGGSRQHWPFRPSGRAMLMLVLWGQAEFKAAIGPGCSGGRWAGGICRRGPVFKPVSAMAPLL